MDFEVLPGTPGLTLTDVAHVLIPGFGRADDGTRITPGAAARCRTALDLHRHLGHGLLVCSGYKAPGDLTGAPWTTPEAPGTVFAGVPEADLMRSWLLSEGAADSDIRAERHSIDTITNLLRSDPLFGDPHHPIAIVSHRGHLNRILTVLAPRTLRRPYLGVVVPGEPTAEAPILMPMARLLTTALPRTPAAAIRSATRRVRLVSTVTHLLSRRPQRQTQQ